MSVLGADKSRLVQKVCKVFVLFIGGFFKTRDILIVFMFTFFVLLLYNHILHIFLCASVHNFVVVPSLGDLIPWNDGCENLHPHFNVN